MSPKYVVVVGRTNPMHVIHDLGVTVPWGHEVSIPFDKAQVSKDLWVSISEKKVFRMGDWVPDSIPTPPNPQDPKGQLSVSGETLIQQIAETNVLLRGLVAKQQEQIDVLHAVLRQLQVGVPASVPLGSVVPVGSPPSSFDGGPEIPMFIPDVSSSPLNFKMDVKEETSSDSGVASAAQRLRDRRKGNPSS